MNELARDDEGGDSIEDDDTEEDGPNSEDPAERDARIDREARERALERHDPFDCD